MILSENEEAPNMEGNVSCSATKLVERKGHLDIRYTLYISLDVCMGNAKCHMLKTTIDGSSKG
jgi:hypothetical protein